MSGHGAFSRLGGGAGGAGGAGGDTSGGGVTEKTQEEQTYWFVMYKDNGQAQKYHTKARSEKEAESKAKRFMEENSFERNGKKMGFVKRTRAFTQDEWDEKLKKKKN